MNIFRCDDFDPQKKLLNLFWFSNSFNVKNFDVNEYLSTDNLLSIYDMLT